MINLGNAGITLSVSESFLLTLLPNAIGSALRIPYTFAVPRFGGRVWTMISAGLLLIPAYYHMRQRLVKYSLTDATIEIDRGLVSRTTQNIPLRRVQDVTVSATLFQRLLGYGDITIDNASEDGAKVVLDDVDSPRKYADQILKQMRRLER